MSYWSDMSDSDLIQCYCDNCKRDTNHRVLHHESEDVQCDYEGPGRCDYYIVQCLGCDGKHFYQEFRNECSWRYDEDGKAVDAPDIHTYPFMPNKVEPLNFLYLPLSMTHLYNESMDCLNRGNLILAAAGFRAIIEAICIDNNITGKNLEVKINNLWRQHIVTTKDKDNLHAVRFIGNDSIHCKQRYSEEEVVVVANIINTMLTSLYVIDSQVRNLKPLPIKDFDDFLNVLNKRIEELGEVGKMDILKNLVKHDRRILSEDLQEFECELIKKISSGEYKKLSLCPKKDETKPQQYKIESMS